jgi:TolB-like protein/DNA-binding winged helix-turn-helix (wHTH) protein
MDEISTPDYEFGGFHLDTKLHCLVGPAGERIALPARAFATLRYLVERAGEIVEKHSLMEAVWPKAVVEENNLNQCILTLRKALGETANERRFILTVPGRGYKFVADVRLVQHGRFFHHAETVAQSLAPVDLTEKSQLPATSGAATAGSGSRPGRWVTVTAGIVVVFALGTIAWRWHASENAVTAPASIAVLPFVNMSSDPEQEYFSDGLSEELVNQFAQVPQLRVIGRTSSFALKGRNEDLRRIGELLGVNHVLVGSVRKSGNRVHITAQLINPADGSLLWSASYERTLDDIFAIQDEIAAMVVSELQLKLRAANHDTSGTKNVAAFDEFLAGRALLNSNDEASMLAAVPHLEHAVELDAAYVPARLWLIDAYTRLMVSDVGQVALGLHKQNEAIDQVVKLVPGSAEASLALSYRAGHEHDLQKMDGLLKESLRVTGDSGMRARLRYGQFLVGVGQTARAISELERVRQDDPLDIFVRTNLLLAYEVAGESARADTEMRQLLQLPGGPSPALLGTAVTRAQGQRDLGALREALAADLVFEKSTTSINAIMQPLLNDPIAARRKLRQLATDSRFENEIYGVSGIAQWAAYLGDKDLALEALNAMRERAFTFEAVAFVLWRPVMRDLRREPGFKELLHNWGLVDYWHGTGNWGDFCKPVGQDDLECH